MSDNTTINPGSGGDTIRDVDRGGGVKTQVVQIDVGGEGQENLVSQTNPVPTQDTANSNQDAPLAVSITGDPNGDFAGVNILEQVIDDASGLNVKVRVVNPPKQDAQGAQMQSDAAPIIVEVATGQYVIVDTTGYQSLNVTSGSTYSCTGANPVTCSNDGISWIPIYGIVPPATVLSGVTLLSGNFISNTNCVFPCLARYIRFFANTGGLLTIYLRAAPVPGAYWQVATNLQQVGGYNTITSPGSANGLLAVGGPVANAAAPTSSPVLIAGVDSGTPGIVAGVPLTRRILTDNQGRIRLAEEFSTSFQNSTPLNVQDTTQQDGQSFTELLAQILLELKVLNHQICELPNAMNVFLQTTPTTASIGGAGPDEDPDSLRNSYQTVNSIN